MKKYKLKNGLTVIEDNKPTDSVTIQVTVKVGSNNEHDGIRGISHFIEHMVFEGTKSRKTPKEITSEIESLGGEINAYTDNVRTCFYIKVPSKHFDRAAEILSDIIINPIFEQKSIDKEREVILKEINIFNDDPRHYQWILFMGTLFDKHPTKYPGYGNKKDVKAITREMLINYYNKYYSASNSIVSIVGKIGNTKKVIEKYFGNFKTGELILEKNKVEELSKKPKVVKTKRKILNSYILFGHKTTTRDNEDAYVLDLIQAILGKGQSGRIFDEIRNKRGLAYEVGVLNEESTDYGFFAVYLSADKKNLNLIKEIIFKEYKHLQNIDDKELSLAKGFVEGRYILDGEDTHNTADDLAFWELIKDAKLEKEYLKKIGNVTKQDIARVAKKYLTENYTLAMIEQK